MNSFKPAAKLLLIKVATCSAIYFSNTAVNDITKNWESLADDLLSTELPKQNKEFLFKMPGFLQAGDKAITHQDSNLLSNIFFKHSKKKDFTKNWEST